MSLRVGVPHYLTNAEHPQAVAALLQHLAHVLDVPLDASTSRERDRALGRALHDEAVADDPKLQTYVRMLEAEHDRRAEAAIPSGDDLAARFEQFLREQAPDDDL